MRYRVRHVTRYAYDEPVSLAAHVLHLEPRVLVQQTIDSSRVSVHPRPSRLTARTDHFGNRAVWAFLDLPHERLEVTLDALVQVAFAAPPAREATPPWEEVAAAARAAGPAAWQASEFAQPSTLAPPDARAGAYAAASFPPDRPVLEGLCDLTARIHRDFTFRPGLTSVATPIARVLSQRAGVCQDFSHVMIAGLRALGLPARYVSGYLRTRPAAGGTLRRGADQSHAWVGAWLGGRDGWVDLDPTNDLVVADEHVVLGWGRDYADVSPVRGVILGGGEHRVTASVDLEVL